MKEPIDSTQPPAWFQAFEERNNSRLDRIESDIRNTNVRFNNLIKVNSLKE
jgi:hypothetical protein